MNKPQHFSAETEAQRSLSRAADDMPLLAAIARNHQSEAPLKGHRIALCGHITEATSVQVRTLVALGADVAWCASSTSTTNDAICTLMGEEVAFISGTRGMSEDKLQDGVAKVLGHWDEGPTIVLDEGARIIRAMHSDQSDISQVRIAAEKTPEGIAIIEDMGADLKLPVLMSDMSVGKRIVDNPHGTSQSLLQTILSVTLGLIAGKTMLVCGFGRVGQGVAQKARGLGARVLVADVRPTQALMAALSGFEVLPIVEALPQADIILTVTGQAGVINQQQLPHLRDGCILVNGGHLPVEIDVAALSDATRSASYAYGLTQHSFEDGKTVFLMADGNIANLSVGTGNPNGVMDTTFSSQVLGLMAAVDEAREPGLYPLPRSSETEVARLIAQSLGIDITDLDQVSEPRG